MQGPGCNNNHTISHAIYPNALRTEVIGLLHSSNSDRPGDVLAQPRELRPPMTSQRLLAQYRAKEYGPGDPTNTEAFPQQDPSRVALLATDSGDTTVAAYRGCSVSLRRDDGEPPNFFRLGVAIQALPRVHDLGEPETSGEVGTEALAACKKPPPPRASSASSLGALPPLAQPRSPSLTQASLSDIHSFRNIVVLTY